MKESANAKYMIRVGVKLDGQARRKDIIGAIFGQTEGLMPDALDLRKLQRSGRIGHIDVNLDDKKGKVSGVIEIPSSLENVESAIIGAALETIERIGPASSKLEVIEITNIRSSKRTLMVDRAKDLLLDIVRQRDTDATGLIDEVRSVLTTSEVTTYKNTGMTCGPNVEDSDALIIVEGRNDVMNLASCGIKNVIAVMGAGVDESLTTLVESKSMVKAFRNIELAVGDGVKAPRPSELKNIHVIRKSIVASRTIHTGDTFTEDNITAKRPGDGRSPMEWDNLIGAKSSQNYLKDELIKE